MNTSKFLGVLIILSLFGCASTAANSTSTDSTPQEPRVERNFVTEDLEFGRGDFSWKNPLVYFVIPDRFHNGNPANDNSYGRPRVDATGKDIGTFHGGDLAGLTQKLEEGYFQELGVNAIWITPPYEQIHGWVGGGNTGEFAHYAFHGYYALDFTNLDANMGTLAELEAFVDTAHSQGIRVIMDVVMNHVGYNTLQDMEEFNFGSTELPGDWVPSDGNWHGHHEFIDYSDVEGWSRWWGKEWVRAGLGDYEPGGIDPLTEGVHGLPDLITESDTPVSLPPILQNKADYAGRRDVQQPVRDWLIEWLTHWVREYGIDGYRVDTAAHVSNQVWAMLLQEADVALQEWRENNPGKPGADWDEPFWATAEVWNHGPYESDTHTVGGFDSAINFGFKNQVRSRVNNLDRMDSLYQDYSNKVAYNSGWNFLSYISSHDTGNVFYSGDDDRQKKGGTALMMAPGGVQIFYGDELGRENGPGGNDPNQGSRSSMDWSKENNSINQHWNILGQFRARNIALAAGEHSRIYDHENGYAFGRSYTDPETGITNTVVVVAQAEGPTSVDVSRFFPEGLEVRNAYDGSTAVVTDGQITFEAGENGLILMEVP